MLESQNSNRQDRWEPTYLLSAAPRIQLRPLIDTNVYPKIWIGNLEEPAEPLGDLNEEEEQAERGGMRRDGVG